MLGPENWVYTLLLGSEQKSNQGQGEGPGILNSAVSPAALPQPQDPALGQKCGPSEVCVGGGWGAGVGAGWVGGHDEKGVHSQLLFFPDSCSLSGCSCTQAVEYWEFRRPWGLFPLLLATLPSGGRNAQGTSRGWRDTFFPYPNLHPPLEAAPAPSRPVIPHCSD